MGIKGLTGYVNKFRGAVPVEELRQVRGASVCNLHTLHTCITNRCAQDNLMSEVFGCSMYPTTYLVGTHVHA